MATKKKKKGLKIIIQQLAKKLYEELGEEDSNYQEGYSDGMQALSRYVKLK